MTSRSTPAHSGVAVPTGQPGKAPATVVALLAKHGIRIISDPTMPRNAIRVLTAKPRQLAPADY